MLRSFAFHELLLLHSSVLKPYFHLSFRQVEHVGQFDSSFSRDVSVHDELALEPARLRPRVGNTFLPPARGEFDDGGPVLVRVMVVRERVSKTRDVGREDGRRHAA